VAYEYDYLFAGGTTMESRREQIFRVATAHKPAQQTNQLLAATVAAPWRATTVITKPPAQLHCEPASPLSYGRSQTGVQHAAAKLIPATRMAFPRALRAKRGTSPSLRNMRARGNGQNIWKQNGKLVHRNCKRCGETFWAKMPWALYCSTKCRMAAFRRQKATAWHQGCQA
jgi:hypothetical protein